MRDTTSSPYYVNKNTCDGKHCRYTGIKVTDLADITVNVWAITISNDDGVLLTVTNSDIPVPTHRDDAAQSLFEAMSIATEAPEPCVSPTISYDGQFTVVIESETGDDIYYTLDGDEPTATEIGMFLGTDIIRGLDVLCVTYPDSVEMPDGRGIIYVRYGYEIEMSGAFSGNFEYLKDGDEKADIYQLCRNISLNFGACKEEFGGKYSNIYSGKKITVGDEGDVITWPTGSIPLIMNNCKLCEYCITWCPRKAILNKIDNKPTSITSLSLDPTDTSNDQLYVQYHKNAQAKDGSEIFS